MIMRSSRKCLPVGKTASLARRVVVGNGETRNGLPLSTRSGLGGSQGATTRIVDAVVVQLPLRQLSAGPPKREAGSFAKLFKNSPFKVETIPGSPLPAAGRPSPAQPATAAAAAAAASTPPSPPARSTPPSAPPPPPSHPAMAPLAAHGVRPSSTQDPSRLPAGLMRSSDARFSTGLASSVLNKSSPPVSTPERAGPVALNNGSDGPASFAGPAQRICCDFCTPTNNNSDEQ